MSKIDQVYGSLRSMIISGELAPGSLIDKVQLAEQLDASRQPISGAVERLAFEGLVEIRPQHGSFVTKLNEAVLKDWLLVRSALETEFAVRFATLAPQEEIAELARNFRYQLASAEIGDVEGVYALDISFHHIISRFTPSAEGHAMLERAQANLGRIRRLMLPEPGRLQHTIAEHRALFEALSAGKPQAAATAMRAHIESVTLYLQHFIAINPALFGAQQDQS